VDELLPIEWKKGGPPRKNLIADQLRDRIERGRLAPGARLPSEKQLVEFYGFSRGTVRAACELLEQEHYIRKLQGVGMFVIDRLPHVPD
jgi:DNA-binding GntR family transcriptional regulator